MGGSLRKGFIFTLLFAGLAAPAAADPLVMFMLGIARQIVEAHAARPADRSPAPEAMPDMSQVYPGTAVEPEHLKRLIDDSFTYLSEHQRREIYDSLHASLSDPKNAAVRGSMIEYFVSKALTIRAAQRQLADMSWSEKERLAREFRTELAALPAEDQAELGALLRSGLLPVPNDLNQLLLAAFETR